MKQYFEENVQSYAVLCIEDFWNLLDSKVVLNYYKYIHAYKRIKIAKSFSGLKLGSLVPHDDTPKLC